MRLNNLDKLTKSEILRGNLNLFSDIVRQELDQVKEELITFPLESIQELRGRAKLLSQLIKLLPQK